MPVLVVGAPEGSSKGTMGGQQDGSIAVGQAMQVLLVGLHQCREGKVLIAAVAGDSATRKQVIDSLHTQQLVDGGRGCEGYENQMSALAALEYVQSAHSLWVKLFASTKPPVQQRSAAALSMQ